MTNGALMRNTNVCGIVAFSPAYDLHRGIGLSPAVAFAAQGVGEYPGTFWHLVAPGPNTIRDGQRRGASISDLSA
jgi:hypothetical protein